MMSARTAGGVLAWTIGGACATALYVFASPALESKFAPVLVDQSVEFDKDDRTPGRFCWVWKWRKVRYAQPASVSWQIAVEGTNVEFPTIAERQRDGQILRNPQAAAIGAGRNDLCVTIPADLDKVSGLTIRGQVAYRMPHGLWTVWQELPVIRIPPLP
jgi:hypothetical protein